MSEVQDHQDELRSQVGTPLWNGYTNMLKHLESLFLSHKHWILEFLQNAEDAESKNFAISLDDTSINIYNDGIIFKKPDFHTICDVNSKKEPSLGLRGYLGIGFKSIFRVTDSVEIHSGQYHFSFDKSHWEKYIKENKLNYSKWPWEILPVEVSPKPLPRGFKTAFHVPLTTEEGKVILKEIGDYLTNRDFPKQPKGMVFPKEIILLLQEVENITITTPSISITITKTVETSERKTFGLKEVASIKKQFADKSSPEETHYLVFRKNVPVREDIKQDKETIRVRRSEVTEREIGLIFTLNSEGELVFYFGALTGVYSFLPIEGEQTGLPFGIFGDFIPTMGRDQINYTATWNKWMCEEIVSFFNDVVEHELLANPLWKSFPSQIYDEISKGPQANQFWLEHLLKPIQKLVDPDNKPILYDTDEKLTIAVGLFDINDNIEHLIGDVITKEDLEKAIGKKLIHPKCSKRQGRTNIGTLTTVGIGEVLTNKKLLTKVKKREPKNLALIYREIQHLSNYYIKAQNKKDTPYIEIPFVLGVDGEMYTPGQTKMYTDIDENSPDFLINTTQEEGRKVQLHPDIGKDSEAVEQLRRCGLEVQNIEKTLSKVKHMVSELSNEQIDSQSPEPYDDLIQATVWLLAYGGGHEVPSDVKVVAKDGTLKLPERVFTPGSKFDWEPLWKVNLLKDYLPISAKYREFSDQYGLQIDQLEDFLKELKVHGFTKKDDKHLITIAGQEVAIQHLRNEGHKPRDVSEEDNLGYDLDCQGHCDKVFEVKGMAEPEDVSLEISQYDKAKNLEDNYVLICVYNLPNNIDRIVCKEIPNPKRICRPVEKAVVPQKEWMTD